MKSIVQTKSNPGAVRLIMSISTIFVSGEGWEDVRDAHYGNWMMVQVGGLGKFYRSAKRHDSYTFKRVRVLWWCTSKRVFVNLPPCRSNDNLALIMHAVVVYLFTHFLEHTRSWARGVIGMIHSHLQYSLYVTWIPSSITVSTCHDYISAFNYFIHLQNFMETLWQCSARLVRLGTILKLYITEYKE